MCTSMREGYETKSEGALSDNWPMLTKPFGRDDPRAVVESLRLRGAGASV